MAKLAVNKSSLKTFRDKLKLYQRFLPSLDLKRQQLLTKYKQAQQELRGSEASVAALGESLTGVLAPLGGSKTDLNGLVTIESVIIDEENIVGAKLPVAREIKFKTASYSTLAKPFWVDFLVEHLQQMCEVRVRHQVNLERVKQLELAVRRITQRVNLFEKILIPTAQDSIKRIQIGLAEDERSAVVRSKIAKRKHADQR